MNPTANVSSSWAKSPPDEPPPLPPHLAVDLLEAGWLPPLPAAYLEGRDLDLLAPLTFVPPGRMPEGEPPAVDRRELARALTVANRAYGHPRADELGRRLADPATRVVVAGQQPGLFGGPLYTLSKMVAASRWAAELEAAGLPAVAVFWVATEDHDWAEVARTTLFTRDGTRTFELGEDPEPLVPVGMRTLGPGLDRVYEEIAAATHGERYEDWLETLARWYRPDARFGEAFCRLMVHFLGEHAPLLLDAMLPEVKEAEQRTLAAIVEHRQALEQGYAAADEEIAARGYPLQVHPQRGASPLFLLHRGQRRRVEWSGGDRFTLRGVPAEAGGTVEDLALRLDDNPATVSAGVLARPAVQDAILGTFLQVLGPGEVSYMAQAAATYRVLGRVLGLATPAVALRPQALVLEPHLEEKLEQTGLTLAQVLDSPERLERVLADRAGQDPVAPVIARVAELVGELREPLLAADPNLERPWEKTRDHVVKSLETLAGKATAARARHNEVEARRVEQLRQTCLPTGKLQERVISSSHYPGKYRQGFADSFSAQLGLDPRALQVVRP